MTAEAIRLIPLRTEQEQRDLKTAEQMGLGFQLTQLILLREIAAQLAEINEAYRFQKGMK